MSILIYRGLRIVEDTNLHPQEIRLHPFATFKLLAEDTNDSNVLKVDVAPDELLPTFKYEWERSRKELQLLRDRALGERKP